MKFLRPSRRRQVRLRMMANRIATGGRWPVQFSHETQQNLRSFFYDGVYASASDAILLTYLTLYLLALGASSADIGWLTALSSLGAVIILLPGAMLVDRFGKRKQTVVIAGGWIGRIPLLLMALVPFWTKGPAAIYIIIALKVILDAARNLSLPAWVSLTADIVPLAWRGRYFGNRNLVMGISAMVITLIIGEVITRTGTPGGYQWSLGVAFGIGMLSTYYFSQINEPAASGAPATPSRYSLGALQSTLKGDRNFLVFCLYTAFWTFSLNTAGPFFSVYHVQTLGATASIVGITTIITRISGIPSQRFFGALADKWGARKLTLVTGFLVPILPFLWLFIRSPWGVVPINILSGIFWAGYSLATFNLLLEISPDEQRARYSAMYQIFVAGSVAIGAAVGGLIANQWGIRTLFWVSGIGRFLSALFFLFGLYHKQFSLLKPVPVESVSILEPVEETNQEGQPIPDVAVSSQAKTGQLIKPPDSEDENGSTDTANPPAASSPEG